MRILELRVKNVRNLKVVEIKPDETAVLLTGKNGAGKSAVLDSIFMALTGKKIPEPIRRGEKRAEISVDLGDVTVKRIFTDEEDRLEVWNKERVLIQSPQAFLDKLLGKLALDPLAFKNMKAKEKSKLLRKTGKLPLAGLNVEGGVVLFKGIPFDQLSLGEQLRISTAVAMSLNPEFRVIFLRYGSLFDEEGLEAIVGIALEGGYQVWIEKVDQSGEVGIYIENGEIVAVNGKRKKEALAGASEEV